MEIHGFAVTISNLAFRSRQQVQLERLMKNDVIFLQCFCAMSLFYCAHWQTYVSGTLHFGRIDVTEAQYTIITIQLISAIFGPSVWSTKVLVRQNGFQIEFYIIKDLTGNKCKPLLRKYNRKFKMLFVVFLF